jgi:hypothetical protein
MFGFSNGVPKNLLKNVGASSCCLQRACKKLGALDEDERQA